MKNLKRYLIHSLILLTGTTFAQSPQASCIIPDAFDSIDANNLMADILPHARSFNGDVGYRKGLAVEDYDGVRKRLSDVSGLWLGGYDISGNLRVAASRYGHSGDDYWAGPLDPITGETVFSNCENFDRVWKVTRADIWTILDGMQNNGYTGTVPTALLEWPGRGNPHFEALVGFELPNQDLAPFYDYNGDGIYDPYEGDYPVFEHGNPDAIAEQILWSVFNDKGSIHTESNSIATGIEVQLTAYAFNCSAEPVLDDVLFMKYKMKSYRTTALSDFRVGFWNDLEIGGHNDDYVGTDTTLNTVYAYNADLVDEGNGSMNNGFGEEPPVLAITFLNEELKSTIMEPPLSGFNDPVGSFRYYRLMGGVWDDGTPLTVGGTGYNPGTTTMETNFIFPDYPTNADPDAWSMPSEGLSPISIQILMNTGRDTLLPQQQLEFDLAYTYIRDTNLTGLHEMTTLVPIVVPQVQAIYDSGFSSVLCAQHPLLSTELVEGGAMEIKVFPNPNSSGQLNVVLSDYTSEWGIEIIDVMGRVVQQELNLVGEQLALDINGLEQGVYFYRIVDRKYELLSSGKLVID